MNIGPIAAFQYENRRFKVEACGDGDFRLYAWVDGWWTCVPVEDKAGEAVLRELARLATARNEGRSAPGGPSLLRVEPQPTYGSSRNVPGCGPAVGWTWPIPEHARRPSCSATAVTASREWWAYVPEEAMPRGATEATLLADGCWYWVLAARTAPAENLPDGSREFDAVGARWRISFRRDVARLFRVVGSEETLVGFRDHSAPPFVVLAEQFAALGREQEAARAEPLLRQARDESARLREESQQNHDNHVKVCERIIQERDRWKNNYRAENRDPITARERIKELEERLAAKGGPGSPSMREFESLGDRFQIRILSGGFSVLKWTPDGWLAIDHDYDKGAPDADQLIENFIALAEERADSRLRAEVALLEERESDSRAEVDDLLRRLEEQKARADAAVRSIESEQRRAGDYDREAKACRIERDLWRSHAEHHEQRALDAEARLADRFWGFGAGVIAAKKPLAEGDPRRMVSFTSNEAGLWALAADGTAWFRRGMPRHRDRSADDLPEDRDWIPVPPLPLAPSPIDANRPEPERAGLRPPTQHEAVYASLREDVSRFGVAFPSKSDPACKTCAFWAASHGDLCAKCFAELGDSK